MTQPSERLADVKTHISEHEESFLARLMEYVKHPSISAQNKGIVEVSQILVEMLNDLGMDAQSISTSGHPMVLGRRGNDPERPTVLFYGHYDVQPPEPFEEWISPPFEPTIRDGRVYARGVGDNKGQHLAQLLAIESWLAVHGELPCNVIFLLEGEEEVGSPHIAEFVRDYADQLKADLVVTSDGPLHISGRPIVVFGVRGMVSFDLTVRTASRDTHSGNFGGVMPNAIWTLVHLLSTMKTPEGQIMIDGLHDAIIAPTEAERQAAAALPDSVDEVMADLDLKRLDAPADRPFSERLMFHPTLTINGLHGGYGGPGSKAVLPCEAIAKCDIRLVEAMTPSNILDKVEAHVAKHAPEVQVVRRGGMLPSKTAMDSPYAAALVDAITEAHGIPPLLYPALGGSLPDYVFTKILDTPAFVVPYANADEANHAPNENLKIECFFNGIQTGAAILAKLGECVPAGKSRPAAKP